MTSAKSLVEVARAVSDCRRCPLYRHATQGVPGEGARKARLMLVGEQPGTDEDLAGKPFVGPAGRVLNAALEEAGIDRRKVFISNAVKHFKFELRGKRRLHKRPNAYEIERCRWWLEQELKLVAPDLVVALGATAARSLFGKPMIISRSRGKVLELPDARASSPSILRFCCGSPMHAARPWNFAVSRGTCVKPGASFRGNRDFAGVPSGCTELARKRHVPFAQPQQQANSHANATISRPRSFCTRKRQSDRQRQGRRHARLPH